MKVSDVKRRNYRCVALIETPCDHKCVTRFLISETESLICMSNRVAFLVDGIEYPPGLFGAKSKLICIEGTGVVVSMQISCQPSAFVCQLPILISERVVFKKQFSLSVHELSSSG